MQVAKLDTKNKWGKPILKEGSLWFKRLKKETEKISSHIRFKRIKHGFYRIYWDQAYLHEVFKEMPIKGYDLIDVDPRLESKKYYEEYEDNAELTRNIKNYIEGYYDSKKTIQTRCYMMRNNWEFNDNARKAYRQMRVY